MRSLTEEETKTLFTKIANYTGSSLSQLVAPTATDGASGEVDRMVFRIQKDRVFYMPLKLANLAVSIPRASLLSVGTMIGKFTKTGKFRLALTSLDIIAPHARYRLWIKPNGESAYHTNRIVIVLVLTNDCFTVPFLYGSNVVRAHIARWSEDAPEHSGCIVYSMDVTARSTAEIRKLDPTAIALFRQADEDTLFTT
ncbi:ribosome biosynthesis protein NIP7 [Penicillium lividum]|nr:ribosome biosynthesis protein NIP7 [Penicillium lividum]